MILSDRTLREAIAAGRIVIDPLDAAMRAALVGRPASTAASGSSATTPLASSTCKQDLESLTELVDDGRRRLFMLHPGEFVLGSTLERVVIPNDLVGRIEGKSSLGRLGLLIHSTAGFVDAGWDGQLTLELSNVANLPITLYPTMKIGQISFIRMTTAADVPYGSTPLGSKYQGQEGPDPVPLLGELRALDSPAPRVSVDIAASASAPLKPVTVDASTLDGEARGGEAVRGVRRLVRPARRPRAGAWRCRPPAPVVLAHGRPTPFTPSSSMM